MTCPPRSRLLAGLLVAVAALSATPTGVAQARANARGASKPPGPPASQAPNGPPLSGEGVPAPSAGGESAAPPSGGDALVENGLGSPMCKEAAGRLSGTEQHNCKLAGFIAAPDPIGDYALDVNINTGPTDWIGNVSSTIQDFSGFAWMVFVAATQGLIVMLEWCYSLDRLTGEMLTQIAGALHGARVSLTEPWLPVVLCVASVIVIYHGIVRRRVAQTLGDAVAMFAMMAVGLWLMADPAGTIGVLDNWANQAGLGTLGAVVNGSPEEPERTFASDMRRLFVAAVDSPWCYMEFGNVSWCESATGSHLREAALGIASKEQSESGCEALCTPAAGPKDMRLAVSAALIYDARTNGQLFLALPANEPARNSTKQESSLLSVLCGGGGKPADECVGPTAAQAEFRSEKGTQPRLIGVILIWLGGLGMLALLGFLALHLLTAAIRTVVFLLLAPAAVLAPAFGESGRALFRTWIARLIAAAASKLIYSFALGVVLLTVSLLLRLTALGWWGQWLVMSAFWWGVFVKRAQIAAVVEGPRASGQAGSASLTRTPVKAALALPRTMFKTAGKLRDKQSRSAPDPNEKRKPNKHPKKDPQKDSQGPKKDPKEDPNKETGHPGPAKSDLREDARNRDARTHGWKEPEVHAPSESAQRDAQLEHEHSESVERVDTVHESRSRIVDRQEKLDRLRRERARALQEKDPRRVAKLTLRAQRVEREIATERKARDDAGAAPVAGERQPRRDGASHGREEIEQRSRFDDRGSPRTNQHTDGVDRPVGSDVASSPATRSTVMEDAFAVAQRRKRQLGLERSE